MDNPFIYAETHLFLTFYFLFHSWSALSKPYIYKRDADHWHLAKDLAKIDASNWRDLL